MPAATKAPAVVALLRAVVFDGDQSPPAPVLHERLLRALNGLRDAGHALPRTVAS